jgi:regulation of enolase protein 1 (concanavalin A-like superfamily)
MSDIDWSIGTWTNPPAAVSVADDGMRVTAVEESDAWRTTSYGFVHDTEHALLAPFAQDTAMEVSFHLDFSAQFDQAGVFVKVDDSTWIKAGVERSDDQDSLGAVVTRGVSDWSLAPVPSGTAASSRSAPAAPGTP